MSSGCCKSVSQERYEEEIVTPEGYRYKVTIYYCKNCGSTKATSNIKHVK